MTLTCYACKKTFSTATTQEEARAEFEENAQRKFDEVADDVVVVCEPCYRRATVTGNWKPTAMKSHLN